MVDLKTDVKNYLGIAISNTDIDTFITAQTIAAEKYFSNMLGQNIATASIEKIITNKDGNEVYLPYSFGTSLSSISYMDPATDTSYTTISSDDYTEYLYLGRIVIRFNIDIYDTYLYKFSLTNGFSDSTFPDLIKSVMTEYIVLQVWNTNLSLGGAKQLNVRNEVVTQGTISTTATLKDLEPYWRNKLNVYTQYSFSD
ncbi:MAG: hypothetical protein GY853_14630 [PVC group bacterium]|nr:hypothetical protein [PVC group bacterium]